MMGNGNPRLIVKFGWSQTYVGFLLTLASTFWLLPPTSVHAQDEVTPETKAGAADVEPAVVKSKRHQGLSTLAQNRLRELRQYTVENRCQDRYWIRASHQRVHDFSSSRELA